MLKKFLFLLAIFSGSLCQILAQSTLSNEEKYNLLRERLRTEFLYYTGNGMERGTSQPMERRYQTRNGLTGYWCDGIWWQGHYVALLATEYARLQQEGKSTDATLKELRCALQVYERLDLEAEKCWGGDTFALPNGFYLRDDIWRSDTSRFGVQWITSDYEYQCGKTDSKRNAPSQDQAWGSYIGFALVQKLVDDAELCQKVAEISQRMVAFMQNKEGEKENWSIINPVTNNEIQPRMDLIWLQYAHLTISDLLSGATTAGTKKENAGRSTWKLVQDNMFISKTGNFRWYGILSMSAVMNDAGSGKDCYAWLVKSCDRIVRKRPDLQQELVFPHLPLINLVLYGKEGKELLPREQYDAYLNSAPADGKLTQTTAGQTVRNAPPWHCLSLFCPWRTADTGEVNMIDYLLLYNLVELVYGSESEKQ